jgi:hypothetical protein
LHLEIKTVATERLSDRRCPHLTDGHDVGHTSFVDAHLLKA